MNYQTSIGKGDSVARRQAIGNNKGTSCEEKGMNDFTTKKKKNLNQSA